MIKKLLRKLAGIEDYDSLLDNISKIQEIVSKSSIIATSTSAAGKTTVIVVSNIAGGKVRIVNNVYVDSEDELTTLINSIKDREFSGNFVETVKDDSPFIRSHLPKRSQ